MTSHETAVAPAMGTRSVSAGNTQLDSQAADLDPFRYRNRLVDFLRGYCLLVMTVNHLPHTPVERFTWQTFGFVSAAEGFVFLSGLVTGWVYGRIALRDGMTRLTSRVFSRMWTIYLAHAVFVTFAVFGALHGFAYLGQNYQPSGNLWARTMLFLETPSLSEVLRLYFFFFLFIPAIFWALIRGYCRYVLGASASLWLIAYMGYGMAAYPNSGVFDLLSWQALFVAAVWLGFPTTKIPDIEGPEHRLMWNRITAIALTLCACFFILRHGHLLTGMQLPSYLAWQSSWRRTLVPFRLINFAAFAYLVFRFRRNLEGLVQTRLGRPVTYLGQHSLQVFLWSICVTETTAVFIRRWERSPGWEQSLFALIICTSCLIPAWLHQQWRQRRERECFGASLTGNKALPSLGSD